MSVKQPYSATIFRPYFNQEVYAKLIEWMKDNRGVWWDKTSGRSWINGFETWSLLVFPDEETLLVCRLMFPEIVYPA